MASTSYGYKTNEPSAFDYRVSLAAKYLVAGRTHSHTFDNCFENLDGDEVVTALMRRAEKNARLRQAIAELMCMSDWQCVHDRIGHLSLAELRARSQEKHAAYAERWRQERQAESDAAAR